MKGAQLAYSHYPQPWLRPRLDTDLLVSPATATAPIDVLRALGYPAGNRFQRRARHAPVPVPADQSVRAHRRHRSALEDRQPARLCRRVHLRRARRRIHRRTGARPRSARALGAARPRDRLRPPRRTSRQQRLSDLALRHPPACSGDDRQRARKWSLAQRKQLVRSVRTAWRTRGPIRDRRSRRVARAVAEYRRP